MTVTSFASLLSAGFASYGVTGGRLLLAVSGGADSIAMLRGVCELAAFEPVVAHLDHGLRGDASHADAEWVRSLCYELRVDAVIERRELESTSEEAARNARYEFLIKAAEETGARVVAVAHTADDQVETILHHILRGTGLAGLAGMPGARELVGGVKLVRPMLEITRRDVLAYIRELRQEFREDASNADTDFTRNRLRTELLPLLERDFNPSVREALLRLGQQAAESQTVLEVVAALLLDRAVTERTPSRCLLQTSELTAQPRHLLRCCFTVLWKQQNWPRGRMRFADWDRLAQTASETAAFTLPGAISVRSADGVLRIEHK